MLSGDEIIALKRPPQPSGLDPDYRIVLGETGIPAEHLDRDRIGFDPVAPILKGFRDDIAEKRCGTTDAWKFRAGDDTFQLLPDIVGLRRRPQRNGCCRPSAGIHVCMSAPIPVESHRCQTVYYSNILHEPSVVHEDRAWHRLQRQRSNAVKE